MAILAALLVFAAMIWGLIRLRNRGAILAVAVALWAALPLYNGWLLQRCNGDCAIRVDLLLVMPVLALASARAVHVLWVWMRGR